VTYGIQKLESQFGIPLFGRTTYRPALTEAGRALLPRARRIAEETSGAERPVLIEIRCRDWFGWNHSISIDCY
jgi:DNA-binding transcriptional LysR family regulator